MDNQGQNPNISKKERTKQNTKNALKAAEKGAGAAFGGGSAGIAAVNAAHKAPVIGDALDKTEDKVAGLLAKKKSIGGVANKLGDSGVTDLANKGLDTAGAIGGSGAGVAGNAAQSAGQASNAASSATNNISNGSNASDLISSIGSSSNNQSTSNNGKNKSKKIKIVAIITAGVGGFLILLVPIIALIVIASSVMQPMEAVGNWIKNAGQTIGEGVNRLDHFLRGEGWSNDEEAFVRSIEKKSNYYKSRGVMINDALIMSTLMTKQLYTSEDPTQQNMGEDFENFDEGRADVNTIPYGNMIGDMRKLVEHQVNKVFGLPSNADPTVYESVLNPPWAILNAAANLLNTTVDSLPLNNINASNANYLAYLRFGDYASKEELDREKKSSSTTYPTGNVRLTHYSDVETNHAPLGIGVSPFGRQSENFRVNEKGWWMYKDPSTNLEYLVVATATTECLNTKCDSNRTPQRDWITYYNYTNNIISLTIDGEEYKAMVLDSCGACMQVGSDEPNKIDIYVSEENGITPVIPDGLSASVNGSIPTVNSTGFWVYKEPSNSDKNRIEDYKKGYIYNAYRDAFKDSSGKDLEGQAIADTAEKIIKTIYEVQESYRDYLGTDTADNTPIEQRTTAPNRTNAFYFDQTTGYGIGYEGECAWYATGRAKEFLASINSTETWTDNPNGGEFCNYNDAQKFNTGTIPKAGSIVSWTGGNTMCNGHPCGHVAFVEKVNEDGSFEISEGAIGWGLYGNGTTARSFIKSSPNEKEARKINCQGGQLCFNYRKNTDINFAPGYQLSCFIYLREPKNGGNQ